MKVGWTNKRILLWCEKQREKEPGENLVGGKGDG